MTSSQVVLNRLNEWRFVPKGPALETGFDLVQNGNVVALKSNARNTEWLEWNFGDGHLSVEHNPIHEYQKPGTYTVTQKISNLCKTISLEKQIEVK